MQAVSLREDARVIGLVGLAHGVSHFYHLILASLFPWLKPAFGLSYAELGFLMTVFFVVSGVGQALAGFLVDRVGARRVLFGGMALLGVAALVLAGATHYAVLIAGSMLAGLGNAVFHPADYTLLNQRVSRPRIAHAFSVHGISGNLGWAAAPVFLGGLAALASWRIALLAAALIPFATLLLLYVKRDAL
ncbi:MAG: MFS transporter, partial [Telluria sp.]